MTTGTAKLESLIVHQVGQMEKRRWLRDDLGWSDKSPGWRDNSSVKWQFQMESRPQVQAILKLEVVEIG